MLERAKKWALQLDRNRGLLKSMDPILKSEPLISASECHPIIAWGEHIAFNVLASFVFLLAEQKNWMCMFKNQFDFSQKHIRVSGKIGTIIDCPCAFSLKQPLFKSQLSLYMEQVTRGLAAGFQ